MSNDAQVASDELREFVQTSDGADNGAAPGAQTARMVDMIVLRAGGRWYGLYSTAVQEVVTKDFTTRVPTAPAHVLGITLVHGRLVPVISLGHLIGTSQTSDVTPTLPRIVIVRYEEQDFGLAADEAHGPLSLEAPTVQAQAGHIQGEIQWKDRLVCVLDAEHLIEYAMNRPGSSR